ncbi:dihydrofolate reductase [Nocardia panacis]|uniref:Dihydrofolate reductase n=2 Tax=Nocardia panacis TaxID=2340916 RepID=A0A3A4KA53_9NOCA|nr:dihydrofolate reductase [Nocardia panacis]
MTTQYYTSTSLDGFLADTNNSLDWLFEVEDDGGTAAAIAEFQQGIGAMCMGATTFEWITSHGAEGDWAQAYGDLPTWVFTHRELATPPGANVRLVSGEIEPVLAEMSAAAGEKNIWLVGGGDLVGQFYDKGRLDEIIATVAPVTLGAGAPLLPRRIPAARLRLRQMSRMGQFVTLTYTLRESGA